MQYIGEVLGNLHRSDFNTPHAHTGARQSTAGARGSLGYIANLRYKTAR